MSSDPKERFPQRLAAIDVGTNSIRMVVAEVERDGTYRVLAEERERARLGEGLERAGELADEPIERSLEAIGRMKVTADSFQAIRWRAVATSALREASNAEEFCREAVRRYQLPIEVITAEQEARLALRSAVRHIELDGQPAAVVDIGGGSMEVILAAGMVIEQMYCLPLGALGLTERYCQSDPLPRRARRALRKGIDQALKQTIGKPPFKSRIMIGSGGTFTALAQILQARDKTPSGSVHGYQMRPAEVVRLLRRLAQMPVEARLRVPGLRAERADIIVAGAALVARLARRLGSQQIVVNERGIRDGLLQLMIAELTGSPPETEQQEAARLDAARGFARRCRSDQQHCEQVARLAGMIFDGLSENQDLPKEGKDILQAAAVLHDVGCLVSQAKNHKHAYRLIRHAELPGFSPREKELIASVARYHRGVGPKKSHSNFARLEPDDARLVLRLSAILRVANGLDRSKTRCVGSVTCAQAGTSVRLIVDAEGNPEAEIRDAQRKSRLFEKAFGMGLQLVWSRDAIIRAPVTRRLIDRPAGKLGQKPTPTFSPECYINRELSWLEFNARVLEEACDSTGPLLERVKFLSIFSSNLDEFFEVRVAGLQQQVRAGLEPQDYPADGLDPDEQLAAVGSRTHDLVAEQYRLLCKELVPELAKNSIEWLQCNQLTESERSHLNEFFSTSVYPVLTPLAIDPGHPFPHVHHKSLNIAVLLERREGGEIEQRFAVVPVPSVIDRVIMLPRSGHRLRLILLEDLIIANLNALFGGFRVVTHTIFRVTRNADLTIDEDEAEDLLETIEETLRRRHRAAAVRLEISADANVEFVQMLEDALDLGPRDVYRVVGPLDLTALMALHRLEGFRTFYDEPLVPRMPQAFAGGTDVFNVIRAQDILVHHPYESFECVVEFIEQAADDPQVLAIKQTLYRTSGPSPIITALARAAQNGKQVTALVELRARYEEEKNILWAKSLEEAGVNVVYGVVGLKTHCKAALVVRREADGIRRYVHLSTGNYNPTTARIYTDLGLFTSKPDFGEDASELFNLLTGYSQGHQWRKLAAAPTGLRERVVELIDRERAHAEAGRQARIVVQMNALVEPSVIDALYRASQAGVRVDLVIRGICCLRPGVPGTSENIRVVSIVDKFLEHSRIFYFENAGDPAVFLGSADWMPRNFFRRIELMFPVEDPRLKARITNEILPILLANNAKSRELQPDGTYRRLEPEPGQPRARAQLVFQKLAREAALQRAESLRPFPPLL